MKLTIIDMNNAPAPEHGQADKAKLLSGEYKTTCFDFFNDEKNGINAGIWRGNIGKKTINYDYIEFCYFIRGRAILTNEHGEEWDLRAGMAFVIPAGFKGTWETLEDIEKYYVIAPTK